MESIFIAEGEHFIPTEWARGPWDPGLLHGGAPAALLAHALEQTRDDPALVVSRFTVDLFRPVKLAPLQTSVNVVRAGGRIKLVDALLHQGGQPVARASALMLRSSAEAPVYPPLPPRVPLWDTLPEWHFPAADRPTFTQATQGRLLTDEATGRVTTIWLRVGLSVLPGQAATPFERLAALSDYTNPAGSIMTFGRYGYINADISVHMHREMAGEWLGFECPGRPAHLGVATTNVLLHDATGPLGSAAVSALANKLPSPGPASPGDASGVTGGQFA